VKGSGFTKNHNGSGKPEVVISADLDPDPGSYPYFSELSDNILGYKYLDSVSIDSNLFLYLFKKLNNFQYCEIHGHLFFCWNRDSRSKIRDKHLGSATIKVKDTNGSRSEPLQSAVLSFSRHNGKMRG
jgi:hypothetical protein